MTYFKVKESSLIITRATPEDAQEILDLQKLAYQSEAAIYQDYTIPPLTQTLPELEAEMQSQLFLKAVAKGQIVGSVRAHLQQETCCIGRLIVNPVYQNRGLGKELMREIEGCFPQAQHYRLFTGHRSERNLYLYQKLGYRRVGSEKISDKLTMVFLEKMVLNNLNLPSPGSSDDPRD
jgi:predicted N-acetyltransferase YhbS